MAIFPSLNDTNCESELFRDENRELIDLSRYGQAQAPQGTQVQPRRGSGFQPWSRRGGQGRICPENISSKGNTWFRTGRQLCPCRPLRSSSSSSSSSPRAPWRNDLSADSRCRVHPEEILADNNHNRSSATVVDAMSYFSRNHQDFAWRNSFLPGALETERDREARKPPIRDCGINRRKKPEPDNSRTLKLLQLNLHKGRPSTAELNKWEYDVALVQEPNVSKAGKMSLVQAPKRCHLVGRARAAIIIGQGLEYWPVESMSSRDLAVIAIMSTKGCLYIASGYMDITRESPTPELDKLVAELLEKTAG